MDELERLTSDALRIVREAISDCLWMRMHDERWAMGHANLLLDDLLMAYRNVLALQERHERLRVYLAEPGAHWRAQTHMKGKWPDIRSKTAQELLDWPQLYGAGGRVTCGPQKWRSVLYGRLVSLAEGAEQVALDAEGKKMRKVARLHSSVIRRSAEVVSRRDA